MNRSNLTSNIIVKIGISNIKLTISNLIKTHDNKEHKEHVVIIRRVTTRSVKTRALSTKKIMQDIS